MNWQKKMWEKLDHDTAWKRDGYTTPFLCLGTGSPRAVLRSSPAKRSDRTARRTARYMHPRGAEAEANMTAALGAAAGAVAVAGNHAPTTSTAGL